MIHIYHWCKKENCEESILVLKNWIGLTYDVPIVMPIASTLSIIQARLVESIYFFYRIYSLMQLSWFLYVSQIWLISMCIYNNLISFDREGVDAFAHQTTYKGIFSNLELLHLKFSFLNFNHVWLLRKFEQSMIQLKSMIDYYATTTNKKI